MSDHSAVLEKWKQHDFFAPDTVVLGIDVGIEGIGIAVRRGMELLYCKSLLVDLPEAEALATRRQMRAARHARKNRRVRMRRLKELFAKHGLPWVDDAVSAASDPFVLRYRAILGQHPLASKEALSLCIRSCVEHRGYDYFAMNSEQPGEYPWGEKPDLPDAKKWISTAYVSAKMKEKLTSWVNELQSHGKELSDTEAQGWVDLVEERAAKAETAGIPAMLKEYYSHKKQYDRKARGFNYPREHVEEHLREILERHKHLIDNYPTFVDALFRECKTAADKKAAIFHYNRKTPEEAKRHFEKKVKDCPYCEWLEIPQAKCALKGKLAVRRWALIDFVANRTFELTEGKLPLGRRTLPEVAVKALLGAMETENLKWMDAKKVLEASIAPLKFAKGKLLGGEWNEGQMKQLKEIVAPDGVVRKRRASMSESAAAKLFDIVTAGGTCFDPSAMEKARKELKLYEKRAEIEATGGIYPQVQTLLGVLRTRGSKEKGAFAVPGFLQRLFEGPLKEKLQGKTVPDYCVIECIKSPAYDKANKQEIEKKIKENQARKLKLAKQYNRENATHADFLRMRLFEEQRIEPGKNPVCPFTGQDLGASPFDLKLAHLFPESRGGLYMAENLVLTTTKVNDDMNNRTPREAAAAGLPGWLSWGEMKQLTQKFRWGEKKRELFAFAATAEQSFPDFNNITRTAQLARELRNRMAVWMGIAGDVEAVRCRIGNPSGVYTAAARRSMLPPTYAKDRSTTLHHRIDAAVMTCIPPAEGLNDVQYGGIFLNEKVNGNRVRMTLQGLPTPDFEHERNAPDGCPIVKQISRSKSKSLGDGTFWRADKEGMLSQRTPIDPEKMSASTIHEALVKMGIQPSQIPAERAIQAWLLQRTAAVKGDDKVQHKPLKLAGGTPIKNIWKFGSKGNIDKSPLGWSGVMIGKDKFDQLRNLAEKNDRLEIWLGWNHNKKCWAYYKRVIPAAAVLAGLKRMGMPWRGRKNAPAYLLEKLDKQKSPVLDLRTMICGVLPFGAVKIGEIRKGDVALLNFPRNEKAVEGLRKKSKVWYEEEHPTLLTTWGSVTAVKSDGRIEISCLTYKERSVVSKSDAEELATLFLGVEMSSNELAEKMNLTPPQ